jgi:hypothetical protein
MSHAFTSACGAIERQDYLRRFTPTPYATALPVMGRTVRLESNSEKILAHAEQLFARYPGSPQGQPQFLWRIVSESDFEMRSPWPRRSAFSDHGLRYAEFGQRNFLAVDLEAREAIAFLSAGLVEDKLGFTSPFLDNLFCMTAGSLGLVSLRANCVSLGNKGLLVFGPHNSGKTTASYMAAKLGLEFHADDGVFGEIERDCVRFWGGFWPAAFRAEALEFLPELRVCTRPFFYRHFTFYHLEEPQLRTTQAHSVIPVGCVFVERRADTAPSLSPIPRIELPGRLAANVLFKDDDRFTKGQTAVLRLLKNLPACELAYDSAPAVVAQFLQRLLANGLPTAATPDK